METLVVALTIFVLAIFVGFEIITKVPPILHTPLMSGSNAIDYAGREGSSPEDTGDYWRRR